MESTSGDCKNGFPMKAALWLPYISTIIAIMAFKSSSQALGMPSDFNREWQTQGVNFLSCGILEAHSSMQAVENALHP